MNDPVVQEDRIVPTLHFDQCRKRPFIEMIASYIH